MLLYAHPFRKGQHKKGQCFLDLKLVYVAFENMSKNILNYFS